MEWMDLLINYGILILYVIALVLIGVFDYHKTKDFTDYSVAGRSQSGFRVTMSLLATIVGASATIGVIDLGYKNGFPAFWWLGVGAIGLVLQSIFLSKRVWELKAYTLPDMVDKTMGKESKWIVSLLIVIAWIGIIAAQFVTASKMLSIITGMQDNSLLLVITACGMILYTFLGGQLSVLKTDFIQFGIVITAIVYTFVQLYFFAGSGDIAPIRIELLNDKFDVFNLVYFLFIVGGTYFIGPDMFSRNFTAKSAKVAQNSALRASIAIVFIGALIALIGVWARQNIPVGTSSDVLLTLINGYLPRAGAILFAFGILSAVVSSADTCLVTVASIVECDMIGKKSLPRTRFVVLIVGVVALCVGMFRKDIIALLMYSYSIYTAGVVMPVFVSILSYPRKKPRKLFLLLAIIVGGALGLIPTVMNAIMTAIGQSPIVPDFTQKILSLAGMGLSLVLSIIAFLPNRALKEL